jgi:histidine triad (HIT) family protein
MATIFTRIIEGELPGRIVWRDEHCAAFLTIEPFNPGHTMVVPLAEVDHWIDLDPELAAHLMVIAQRIGRAQMAVFAPVRVGLIIAGFEVPHAHMHVVPINGESELQFANADRHARPEDLDAAAEGLRGALRAAGYPEPNLA